MMIKIFVHFAGYKIYVKLYTIILEVLAGIIVI
jgi:hypothetical protein